MQDSPQSNRTNGDKDAVLANVALLYYGQGLTQSEIAKRMQVSRATIVNMLRESREKGLSRSVLTANISPLPTLHAIYVKNLDWPMFMWLFRMGAKIELIAKNF